MSIPSPIRDAPKTFRLSVRVNANHGGRVDAAVQDLDNLKGSGFRFAMILVHGFNNSAQEARDSYRIQFGLLVDDLKRSRIAPDAVAEFQWPGDEEVVGPNALGYATDIQRALDSAQRFAAFLADIGAPAQGAPAVKLALVGHSLGCRLIIEALAGLPARNAPTFDVISLMAAALPVELVDRGRRLSPTQRLARRLLKFYSENDDVLHYAFPLGQRWASIRRIESAYYAEAVGRSGDPRQFGTGFDQKPNGHSDYWRDPRAAGTLLETIDPTLWQPPEPERISDRPLPARPEIVARSLPGRTNLR
jgi:esterase/lipase superfamily enzyme